MKKQLLFLFVLLSFYQPTELIAQDFENLKYRAVGPSRGGRVTTVTGTPMLPGTFYLGASGAGVWKTDDYGVTWNNISDGYFDTPSIGAIEVAVNDPNIVYVGTGSDGLRSNVIAGRGMYKSVDAGKTWDHIGLKDVGQIGAVEIDPTNHNIVWVAAIGNAFRSNPERGIYKTTDGGKTWRKVLYISDNVGFADLELLPGNPNTIYAAAWKAERKPWTIISGGTNEEGGIYKSVDGGKNWSRLGKGLPQGLIGKIDLAVSPVDSKILYAVIEAPGKEGGLYKSVNQGKSFKQISDNIGLVNRPFYYTNIELDPNNPDIVYSNANPLLKSVNGGKTWKRMSVPHGDNHDIWINPNDSELFIQANDGGANVTTNGGKTWSTQFNQPTAELYQVEVDDQYPYWLYAGQQDNYSTIAVPSMAPSTLQMPGIGWVINTGGCETGPAVPKPGDPNTVYVNCKGRFGVFNKLTGTEKGYYVGASNLYGHNPKDLEYRFQRVAPIHVSPHNPDVVYHGSQFLHKTVDDGLTWETISPDLTAFEADKQVVSGSPITRDITGEEYYSALYSIRESKLREGLIWTGSNDGPVHLTKDGGKTWLNVTPADVPKGGRVEAISPSHHQEGTAYIAIDRHLLGDSAPYIYKTTDYGSSWIRITNGIPGDFTARVVREDPIRPGLLYAGTEYGVFISFDDGRNWQVFQQNLPITPITDIKIFRGDLVLSTMGRGFWILDNIALLRQQEINSLKKSPVLFKPDAVIRYRNPMQRTGSNVFPRLPRTQISFDYYLPEKVDQPLELQVFDNNNSLVISILSGTVSDKNKKEEELRVMSTNEIIHIVNNSLSTNAGINRFQWNLQYPGAWSPDFRRSYQNGPMASPGTYKVQLKVGDTLLAQPFEIIIDPKSVVQGMTETIIANQLEMQLDIVELLSEVRRYRVKLEKEAKSLQRKKSKAKKARLIQLNMALKQLKNDGGPYPQQMLESQVSYLLNMIRGADQKPGKDAHRRLEELKAQYKDIKSQLEEG